MSYRWVVALAGAVFCSGALAAYHVTPPVPRQATPEPAAPWAAVWTRHRVHAGVIYFLDAALPRIRRYHAASSTWLPDIALTGAADAFDVDDSGIYVHRVGGVERYALDGSSHVELPLVAGNQPMLEVVGNALVVADGEEMRSYDKTSAAPINSISAPLGFRGVSAIDSEGQLFGTTTGVSPADVVEVTLNPSSGVLLGYTDTPFHGDYPIGDAVFARDAGGMVISSSGVTYSSAAMDYLGSLGGTISGAAFLADRFAVVRDGSVVVFGNDLRELGVPRAPLGLLDVVAVDGHLFGISGSMASLAVTPLDPFAVALPPRPRVPEWGRLASHADFVLGDAGRIMLVSKADHAAWRFDPAAWSSDATVSLYLNPQQAAYASDSGRLYVAYDGGAIYSFGMGAYDVPAWLAATPYTAFGLATAGDYVMAADASGAWATHYMFAPDGTLLSNPDWNYYSRQYEWDPILRRIYFFRDDTSPDDLHFEHIGEDGTIVGEGESPYHGEVQAQTPIRVSPDGARIVLGSGQVFESGGLTMIGQIGEVAETAWLFGDMFAISAGGDPRLQRFDSMYHVVSSGRVRGTPRRLLPSGSGFVYVADIGSTTVLGRLDGFMAQADLAVDPVSPGSVFDNGSQLTIHFTVGNNGVVPAPGTRVTADVSGLEDLTWRCIPATGVAGCDGAVSSAPIVDVIDLDDGGQAEYELSGRIPAVFEQDASISVHVQSPAGVADPEPRNNGATIVIPLDKLFADGFD